MALTLSQYKEAMEKIEEMDLWLEQQPTAAPIDSSTGDVDLDELMRQINSHLEELNQTLKRVLVQTVQQSLEKIVNNPQDAAWLMQAAQKKGNLNRNPWFGQGLQGFKKRLQQGPYSQPQETLSLNMYRMINEITDEILDMVLKEASFTQDIEKVDLSPLFNQIRNKIAGSIKQYVTKTQGGDATVKLGTPGGTQSFKDEPAKTRKIERPVTGRRQYDNDDSGLDLDKMADQHDDFIKKIEKNKNKTFHPDDLTQQELDPDDFDDDAKSATTKIDSKKTIIDPVIAKALKSLDPQKQNIDKWSNQDWKKYKYLLAKVDFKPHKWSDQDWNNWTNKKSLRNLMQDPKLRYNLDPPKEENKPEEDKEDKQATEKEGSWSDMKF